MKRILTGLFFVCINTLAFANSGLLFQVTPMGGPPESTAITLCLDGNAPLSCQIFDVNSLDLQITPTVPNHFYPAIGIRTNRPGYQLQGCTPIANGYCLFSASNDAPVTIHLTKVQYDVVIDAGSSGTRVYVYKTTTTGSSTDPVIDSLFTTRNQLPLATCAVDTKPCVEAVIQPLLTSATEFLKGINVPNPEVPASVLGTAGMRLLPVPTQEAIYKETDHIIRNNHYLLGETETISGQQEGLYQWLNINYQKSTFGEPYTDTFGTIEFGGASSQVAFVTTSTSPNGNVIPLNIDGQNYNLYSVSFLGLGQNAARAAMNAQTSPSLSPNYCYPVGYNSGSIVGDFMSGISSPPGCSPNYNSVITQFTNPSVSDLPLVPGFSNQSYYGVGGIYYNFTFLGVTPNPTESTTSTAINTICAHTYAELQLLYPNQPQLFNSCGDSTYNYSFVYAPTGLNLGSTPLIVDNISANFTLGFVYSLNKTPSIYVY